MNGKCSHGKTWKEDCKDCDAVWATRELRSLTRSATMAAEYLDKNPRYVMTDPRVVTDLYRSIARLAKILSSEHCTAQETP